MAKVQELINTDKTLESFIAYVQDEENGAMAAIAALRKEFIPEKTLDMTAGHRDTRAFMALLLCYDYFNRNQEDETHKARWRNFSAILSALRHTKSTDKQATEAAEKFGDIAHSHYSRLLWLLLDSWKNISPRDTAATPEQIREKEKTILDGFDAFLKSREDKNALTRRYGDLRGTLDVEKPILEQSFGNLTIILAEDDFSLRKKILRAMEKNYHNTVEFGGDYHPIKLAEHNTNNPEVLLLMQLFDLYNYFSKKRADTTHVARWEHFEKVLKGIKDNDPALPTFAAEAAAKFVRGKTKEYSTKIQALINTASTAKEGKETIEYFEEFLNAEQRLKYRYGQAQEDWITSIKKAVATQSAEDVNDLFWYHLYDETKLKRDLTPLSPEELNLKTLAETNTDKAVPLIVALHQVVHYFYEKKLFKSDKWDNFNAMIAYIKNPKGDNPYNDAIKRWGKSRAGTLTGGLFGQKTQVYLDRLNTLRITANTTLVSDKKSAFEIIDPFLTALKKDIDRKTTDPDLYNAKLLGEDIRRAKAERDAKTKGKELAEVHSDHSDSPT